MGYLGLAERMICILLKHPGYMIVLMIDLIPLEDWLISTMPPQVALRMPPGMWYMPPGVRYPLATHTGIVAWS